MLHSWVRFHWRKSKKDLKPNGLLWWYAFNICRAISSPVCRKHLPPNFWDELGRLEVSSLLAFVQETALLLPQLHCQREATPFTEPKRKKRSPLLGQSVKMNGGWVTWKERHTLLCTINRLRQEQFQHSVNSAPLSSPLAPFLSPITHFLALPNTVGMLAFPQTLDLAPNLVVQWVSLNSQLLAELQPGLVILFYLLFIKIELNPPQILQHIPKSTNAP